MKCKVKATGEIIEVSSIVEAMYRDITTSGIDEKVYYESELEFLPDTPGEVTIEGWVARDKGGGIYLHHSEPVRGTYEWYSVNCPPRQLPIESFPEVTWDSEPLKVKLTITPME